MYDKQWKQQRQQQQQKNAMYVRIGDYQSESKYHAKANKKTILTRSWLYVKETIVWFAFWYSFLFFFLHSMACIMFICSCACIFVRIFFQCNSVPDIRRRNIEHYSCRITIQMGEKLLNIWFNDISSVFSPSLEQYVFIWNCEYIYMDDPIRSV